MHLPGGFLRPGTLISSPGLCIRQLPLPHLCWHEETESPQGWAETLGVPSHYDTNAQRPVLWGAVELVPVGGGMPGQWGTKPHFLMGWLRGEQWGLEGQGLH